MKPFTPVQPIELKSHVLQYSGRRFELVKTSKKIKKEKKTKKFAANFLMTTFKMIEVLLKAGKFFRINSLVK